MAERGHGYGIMNHETSRESEEAGAVTPNIPME